MTDTTTPSCANCHFARSSAPLIPEAPLECHYDPPIPSRTEWGWQAWGWPRVNPDAWCGKHMSPQLATAFSNEPQWTVQCEACGDTLTIPQGKTGQEVRDEHYAAAHPPFGRHRVPHWYPGKDLVPGVGTIVEADGTMHDDITKDQAMERWGAIIVHPDRTELEGAPDGAVGRLANELAELGWTVHPDSTPDHLILALFHPEGGRLTITYDAPRLSFFVVMTWQPAGLTQRTEWSCWLRDEAAVDALTLWSDAGEPLEPLGRS